MSFFDSKQIIKPRKVLVPRSAQKVKEKKKGLPFISTKDNGIRVHRPGLDKSYMKNMIDMNEIALKVKNQKINVIKEMFQQKFNNLKAINFPFHNLAKANIYTSHQKEGPHRNNLNKSPLNKVMRVTTFKRFVSVKPLTHRRQYVQTPSPNNGVKIQQFEHSKSITKFNLKTEYNTKRSFSDSDEDRMDASIYSELYLKN